tara:strand:- start:2861 stop:3109 length:249 start_codon:yes stop_codon:yes gene_type:complete
MPRRVRNNNTNSGSSSNNQQVSPRSVLNRKSKPRTQRRQRRRRTPAPPPSPVSPQHRLSQSFLATMWGWAAGYFSNPNNNRN